MTKRTEHRVKESAPTKKANRARPRRRIKGETSRSHILDVCSRIFHTSEYRDATMRDIAREAEIALGGLYFHFKSKDELIAALIERGSLTIYQMVRDALQALPASATSRQKLEAAIHAHIGAALRHGEYSLTLRYLRDESSPDIVCTTYKSLREAHRNLWMTHIQDAQNYGTLRSDMPPMLMFFYIHGAIGWVPEWYNPRRTTPERIADHFCLFFLEGATAAG
jgi:AcrR family transcriptional regulator